MFTHATFIHSIFMGMGKETLDQHWDALEYIHFHITQKKLLVLGEDSVEDIHEKAFSSELGNKC